MTTLKQRRADGGVNLRVRVTDSEYRQAKAGLVALEKREVRGKAKRVLTVAQRAAVQDARLDAVLRKEGDPRSRFIQRRELEESEWISYRDEYFDAYKEQLHLERTLYGARPDLAR